MINKVRDTLASAQLATASLNFGVGRSQSLCVKSPIEARTPATQNFCQLLSFGCELLKLSIISLFVFFGEFYRVSHNPVASERANRGRGENNNPEPPPAHVLILIMFTLFTLSTTVSSVLQRLTLFTLSTTVSSVLQRLTLLSRLALDIRL